MQLNSLKCKLEIYLKIVFSYLRRKSELRYIPPVLWVEPTNQCNLRCVMCPNSIIDSKDHGFMEMGVYTKIIDEFSSFYPDNTGTIALFLSGEPLLHRQISDMIAYARERGVKVNLATNATLLTAEKVEALLASKPTLLILSFDGYDKQTYEAARQGANFDQSLANIRYLLHEKQQRGVSEPKVRIYSLILRSDQAEAERARYSDFFRHTFDGLGVDEFLIEVARDWAGTFAGKRDGIFVPVSEKTNSFYPCVRLWDSMSIRWDGGVVPCCADFTGKVILGNAGKNTLMEIWTGEPYRMLREKMIHREINDIPLCSKGCDLLYPAGVRWGLPRELQLHRKVLRNLISRVAANRIN